LLWCRDREIWITPTHITGGENTEADLASGVFNDQNDQTEWKLDLQVVTDIFTLFGKPEVVAAPHCPTQSWFPKLTRLLVQIAVLLSNHPNMVHLSIQARSILWGQTYS